MRQSNPENRNGFSEPLGLHHRSAEVGRAPFYRRMKALLDEDTTGGVELVVFPDTFAQYERLN